MGEPRTSEPGSLGSGKSLDRAWQRGREGQARHTGRGFAAKGLASHASHARRLCQGGADPRRTSLEMLIYYAEQFQRGGGRLHSTLRVASRPPCYSTTKGCLSIKGI